MGTEITWRWDSAELWHQNKIEIQLNCPPGVSTEASGACEQLFRSCTSQRPAPEVAPASNYLHKAHDSICFCYLSLCFFTFSHLPRIPALEQIPNRVYENANKNGISDDALNIVCLRYGSISHAKSLIWGTRPSIKKDTRLRNNLLRNVTSLMLSTMR